jgi:hypothetical protein
LVDHLLLVILKKNLDSNFDCFSAKKSKKKKKKSFLNALFINEEDLSGGGKKEKFRSF